MMILFCFNLLIINARLALVYEFYIEECNKFYSMWLLNYVYLLNVITNIMLL